MSTPTETAAPTTAAPTAAAFAAAWQEWHAAHERHRADPHGSLAVTHLHWLGESAAPLDGVPGTWRVEALFTDATSGKTTYAANRSLTVAPDVDGSVVLDFNRAVNLPCAYTDLATCPLPPCGEPADRGH